jgi:hypothetical protein
MFFETPTLPQGEAFRHGGKSNAGNQIVAYDVIASGAKQSSGLLRIFVDRHGG